MTFERSWFSLSENSDHHKTSRTQKKKKPTILTSIVYDPSSLLRIEAEGEFVQNDRTCRQRPITLLQDLPSIIDASKTRTMPESSSRPRPTRQQLVRRKDWSRDTRNMTTTGNPATIKSQQNPPQASPIATHVWQGCEESHVEVDTLYPSESFHYTSVIYRCERNDMGDEGSPGEDGTSHARGNEMLQLVNYLKAKPRQPIGEQLKREARFFGKNSENDRFWFTQVV